MQPLSWLRQARLQSGVPPSGRYVACDISERPRGQLPWDTALQTRLRPLG